jgi:hypothetical protein
MKIILKDIEPDDWILGIRAAKFLVEYPVEKNDAILSYGEYPGHKDFFVKRNKASITVRPY